MPAPDQRLFQRWGHSFEEDHEGVLVYRPADFDFPRARGRDGIEFRADGSYVDWVVGPGDARQPRVGSWQLGDDGRLRLTTAAGAQRVVEVVQLAPDRLELQSRNSS
jgi:hypothetical protein